MPAHIFSAELFQCGIHYRNMLYSHLLLVCVEAIYIESIWINSYSLNVQGLVIFLNFFQARTRRRRNRDANSVQIEHRDAEGFRGRAQAKKF